MRAIRFHYRPGRYLFTRWASGRFPTVGLGPLGSVRLDEVEPLPLPGPDWVRLETMLSGICGSDLAALTAHDSLQLEPFGAYPFTFGHEVVGRIVEVGAEAGGWGEGDEVVVNPMLACRQRGLDPPCAPCERGEFGLCRRTNDGTIGAGPMTGFCPGTGGGWADGFVAHVSQLHRMGGLTPEVAVLADPFASALRPVLLHPPEPEDEVLVIGSGTIGLLTVHALRSTGWDGIIAVLARYPFQRERAERAGADQVFDETGDLFEWAGSRPGARAYDPTLAPEFVEGGPSLVFDTVGSQRTANTALALTREDGRIVLVGSAAKVAADWTRIWYRQLTLAGVFAYGEAPFRGERRDAFATALDLMRETDDELDYVTHTFDLEEYRGAIAVALDKQPGACVKAAFRAHV